MKYTINHEFVSISSQTATHRIILMHGWGADSDDLLTFGKEMTEKINLEPLIVGGGQEYGLRSGTLPLPLVVGFAKAIEIAVLNQKNNAEKLLFYRNNLLEGLLKNNSGLLINGSIEKRLPHNLNLTVLDLNGAKFHKLLKSKIICSSGSACSNGEPSHVLLALGRSFKEAESSIRLSIGLSTNSKDIEQAIHILTNTIKLLR